MNGWRRPNRKGYAMTSRIANLVHTRFQHRNRRVTCGMMLTAATLVAVVLFLATTASTSATGPCDGLSTVVVTAAGSGTTSGSSTAPSANCDISVQVTPPATGGASGAAGAAGATAPEPCVVTATPHSLGSRGAEVTVRTTGNCDGVKVATQIDVNPQRAPATADAATLSGVSGQSASYSAVTSRVTTWHFLPNPIPDILLFWSEVTVSWQHTLSTIVDGWISSDYHPSGCGWRLLNQSRSLSKHGNTLYEGTVTANWMARCLGIEARSNSRVAVYAKPGGAHRCAHEATFSGGLPGFRYVGSCLSQ